MGNTNRKTAQSKIPITANMVSPAFLAFSEIVNLAHSLANQIISVNSAFYQFLMWGFEFIVTYFWVRDPINTIPSWYISQWVVSPIKTKKHPSISYVGVLGGAFTPLTNPCGGLKPSHGYQSGLYNSFADSVFHQFRPRMKIKFTHDIFTVAGDSFGADAQLFGNFSIAIPIGQ